MKICIPGVNKILGTFVSWSQGPAVCILDDKKLIADFKERNDNTVRACLEKTGECKKLTLASLKSKKDDKWFDAVKGVYCVFTQKYPNVKCFDITLNGDLLDCEGRIVLSAITVATVKALNQSMKLGLSNDDIFNLSNLSLAAVSKEGNLSDIISMIYAKEGQFVVYDGLTGHFDIFENPFEGSEYSMLVIDGHVPVSAVREEAAEKIADLTYVFKAFYNKFGRHYVEQNDPDYLELYNTFDEDGKRLAKYLYDEHKSAVNFYNDIKEKDIQAIGRAFDRVRKAYNENLDMTCPEIEWILKRACESSCYVGGCIFFEGYCTKAIIVVKNSCVGDLYSRIEEYQHIFGFDIATQTFGGKK